MTSETSLPPESPEPETSASPEISRKRSFSKVWVVPILGLFLGAWLVKTNYDQKGELIAVTFQDANGLTSGKTEVRCRNVQIGVVENVTLNDALEVIADLRIKPEHAHLVRKESQFWVVRPRVSGTSVSGLNTLISGSYVELDPGPLGDRKYQFVAEEEPPLTPASVPGLRLVLTTTEPGSVDIGSGVYFKGNLVGRVESRVFSANSRKTQFGIFIEEKYADLVTTSSRFWRGSGLKLEVGADGFKLDLPSLDSLVSGRVNFGLPENAADGEVPEDRAEMTLYANLEAAESSTFEKAAEFLLLLDQSVRGLAVNAPVEFRGMRVGRVGKISYKLVENSSIDQIPVLIQLNARLLTENFPPSLRDEGAKGIETALAKGLRASLKSSSLLTGQIYVDLDYYPNLPPGELAKVGDYAVLPTAESGLARLEDQVSAVLAKLTRLPIEPLLAEATGTLKELRGTLEGGDEVLAETKKTMQEATATVESLKILIAGQEAQALPADIRATLAQLNETLKPYAGDGAITGDLRRTLDELRSAVRSFERTSDTIGEKPNSLLFGKPKNSSRIPRARP